MRKVEPKVVAFWRYDHFPKVLGGAGAFTDHGDFFANNYEATFRRQSIVAVYSLEDGAKRQGELTKLAHEHRLALEKLTAEFEARAALIIPELKKAV